MIELSFAKPKKTAEDKEPRIRISRCLLIGVDISDGKDISALQVSERVGQGMVVRNIFYGEEAEWMYDRLVGKETGEYVTIGMNKTKIERGEGK